MNIGDRVRSISSSEEGVITKFLPTNEVEVEIEDGFRIPYLRTDLVVVSAVEKDFFGDDTASKAVEKDIAKEERRSVDAIKGIFLAFTHYNDKILEVHLANNTDFVLSAVFCEEENKNFHGIYSGQLPSRKSVKIHEVNIDKFERWPVFVFQFLYFKPGKFSLPTPLICRKSFKANSFFKHKKEIPLIAEEGYCFQLDEEEVHIDANKLKESLAGGKSAHISYAIQSKQGGGVSKVSKREVDLHIEALLPNHGAMSNAQIISVQLDHFEHALDKAILDGLDEVVFIHGVGAGVLKSAISKRLSGHQHVAYFQDAQKGKFGYGATLVKIK